MKIKEKFTNKYIAVYFIVVFLFFGVILKVWNYISIDNILSFYKEVSAYSVSPNVTTMQGTCKISNKIYDLVLGNYEVPTRGSAEQSKPFEGYSIFRYFYPSCPVKNVEDREFLFKLREKGEFNTGGNIVINGSRILLLEGSATFGRFDFVPTEEKIKSQTYFMLYSNNFNAYFSEDVVLNQEWNPNNYFSRGPSVYFSKKHSKLMFKTPEYSFSNTMGSRILEISSDCNDEPGEMCEYFNNGGLNNPTDFDYQGEDFYITDKGNRRIVKYNNVSGNSESLGGNDWGWQLEGIAVDYNPVTDERFIYTSDSEKDIIIRTKIDGDKWIEFPQKDEYKYYDRLFITGEEKMKFEGNSGSITKKAFFIADGFADNEVIATSSLGYLFYDPVLKKIKMQDKNDKIFGDYSLKFNESNRKDFLIVKDHNSINFFNEEFTIDFMIKFDSLNETQMIFEKNYNYSLSFNKEKKSLELILFYDFGDGIHHAIEIFRTKDNPDIFSFQANKWYHIAITRGRVNNTGKEVKMFVNGKKMDYEIPHIATSSPIFNPPNEEDLIIGAEKNKNEDFKYLNYFKGNIDNFRISKGYAKWRSDFVPDYYFYNPGKIALKGDYFYVVDSGNNRIVKVKKDFSEWSAFGSYGSGTHQFKNPTYISYKNPYFYIVDSGNNRVIKSDLNNLGKLFEEGNPSWSLLSFPSYLDKSDIVYNESFFTFPKGWKKIGNVSMSLKANDPESHNNYVDIVYKDYIKTPLTSCGSESADICCGSYYNFPSEQVEISSLLYAKFFNKLYSNRKINVKFKAKKEDVLGGVSRLNVFITRTPGKNRNNYETNRELNLVKTVSLGSDWSEFNVEFTIPERIGIEQGLLTSNTQDPVYLSFSPLGSCGRISIDYINMEIVPDLVEPIAAKNIGGNLFIADGANSVILKNNAIIGGKNPDYGIHKFIYPVDIAGGNSGAYYILDSTSDKDFAVISGGDRMVETYGTDQDRDIAVKFTDGGLNVLGKLSVNGVYRKDRDNPKTPVADEIDMVWVGYDLGPKVSRCPIVKNTARTYGPAHCHLALWGSEMIDVADCSFMQGKYQNSPLGWKVDCKKISEDYEAGLTSIPVPLTECIDASKITGKSTKHGIQDWEKWWSSCVNYNPNFEREGFCEVDWEDGVDHICQGAGCCDVWADSKVSMCQGCKRNNTCGCDCPEEPEEGSTSLVPNINIKDFFLKTATAETVLTCDTYGKCAWTKIYKNCPKCDDTVKNADSYFSCNHSTCKQYNYTWGTTVPGNSCSCSGNTGECDNECSEGCDKIGDTGTCGDIFADTCSIPSGICREITNIPSPNVGQNIYDSAISWHCAQWYYSCLASCQASHNDCSADSSVRWRPDYKKMVVTVGKLTHRPSCYSSDTFSDTIAEWVNLRSFTIDLFYNQTPAPYEMEYLIKEIEDNRINAKCKTRENDCADPSLYYDYKTIQSQKKYLLNSGTVSGVKDFEEYLNDLVYGELPGDSSPEILSITLQ